MTPDEEGFFRTSLENPDDDTPRLVYADWLEERGEPERAEFIRVQCELAQLAEDDPRRPELQARQDFLEPAHESDLNVWLIVGMTQVVFHRGFIARLEISHENGLQYFLSRVDQFFRFGPVRHLDVRGWLHGDEVAGLSPGSIAALVYLPQMRLVRRLTLEGIDDQAGRAVARSPYLEHLNRVRIHLDYCYWEVIDQLQRRFGKRAWILGFERCL